MIAECERLAYADGLAPGLRAAQLDADLSRAPGGVAAVPFGQLPAGATALPHRVASEEGVTFLRCTPDPAAGYGELAARLGAVRLGITRRLVDWAVEQLTRRTSGGEPMIRKQLVLGAIADLETSLAAARHALPLAVASPAAMADVHDRITELDWEATKLLGGSGYVAGTPARTAYVSRLVANCWIPREGAR